MPKLHKVYTTKKRGPTPGKDRRRGAKPPCKAISGTPGKSKNY